MQVKVAVAGPGPISRKPVLAAAEPCDCPTCGRCSSTIKVFTRASWTRTCQHRSWHESGLAHCVRGHVPGPHLQNAVQEAVGGRRDSKNHLPNRRATPGTSGDRSQQLRRSWLIHRQRANKSRRGGGKKRSKLSRRQTTCTSHWVATSAALTQAHLDLRAVLAQGLQGLEHSAAVTQCQAS